MVHRRDPVNRRPYVRWVQEVQYGAIRMAVPMNRDAEKNGRSAEAGPHHNDLLARLPATEWSLIEPYASIVTLKHAQVLFTDVQPADLTYFPLTSIVSMIAEMANGDECEYGCIGREGMLGLQVALGSQPLRGRALCQLEGKAIRLDGAILRKVTTSGEAPELHRLLLRYAQATINVLAQSAACNALHNIPMRTARWAIADARPCRQR
jgi:hypothetical protein